MSKSVPENTYVIVIRMTMKIICWHCSTMLLQTFSNLWLQLIDWDFIDKKEDKIQLFFIVKEEEREEKFSSQLKSKQSAAAEDGLSVAFANFLFCRTDTRCDPPTKRVELSSIRFSPFLSLSLILSRARAILCRFVSFSSPLTSEDIFFSVIFLFAFFRQSHCLDRLVLLDIRSFVQQQQRVLL